MKVAEDESYNAMTIEMRGDTVGEAEMILEAVDKGDENSDEELDRVEIAMSQYIGHTAEQHGLSVVPDDEEKDKWLLLGDDTQDFGWDPSKSTPRCSARPLNCHRRTHLFDQETVVSLELLSEVDESEAAGMSSMITAESVTFESVTEGTSASKQPPTPPPPRRGTAAKSAVGEPQSTGFIETGDESDQQAPGDAKDCKGQSAARQRRGGTPVEKAEGPNAGKDLLGRLGQNPEDQHQGPG